MTLLRDPVSTYLSCFGLAAMFIAGCSLQTGAVPTTDDLGIPTATDAGFDGSRSDGGTDGGADGGTDGGTDGGPDGGTDGGTDGGPDGGDGGLPPWTPAVLGLLSDYDAADAVHVGGLDVTSWPDRAGGFGVLTPTGGSTPTYTASVAALNGMPAVSFDAAIGGQRLDSAPLTTPIGQPATWIVVLHRSGAPLSGVIIDSSPAGRNALRRIVDWDIYAGAFVLGGAATAGAHKLVAVFDGAVSMLYVDNFGAPLATGDAGNQSPSMLRLAASVTGTHSLTGSIARVLVFPRALSPTEVRQVGDYLNMTYGLTG